MLRKIADFILFMQKDNGSYYSKYKPLKGGRNDEWTSLYYPGEAALGLALLYEIDKDPKWIQGAIKTITYLANSRKHSKVVPEDHWAMLATNQIFKLSKTNDFKFPKKLFVDHAVKVCNSLLKMFVFENWDGTYKLKSLKTGRTAPVGTRLEGLLAAYQFLPDNLTVLKNNIKGAAESGMKFLISAQVVSGKYKGGFPGQVIYYSSRNMYKIDPEIRIDYVQHAMSAQINYLELFYK
ncbi:MAG: hypothetical protein GTO02_11725 [Candidatus Dadabacteria bacterium]|nr:hypothetical protein [Candidatus Dadabacteria bacterium]NIQ15022.1 hypothetical protein [Candidatus Dadabacteria bacterium]